MISLHHDNISLSFNFLHNFRGKYQESSIGFENLAHLQSIENKCKSDVDDWGHRLRFIHALRRFDSDTCCELAKPKEGRLSKCLIHASRKPEKEKREKFLVTGATRCATNVKIDIY